MFNVWPGSMVNIYTPRRFIKCYILESWLSHYTAIVQKKNSSIGGFQTYVSMNYKYKFLMVNSYIFTLLYMQVNKRVYNLHYYSYYLFILKFEKLLQSSLESTFRFCRELYLKKKRNSTANSMLPHCDLFSRIIN